MSTRTQAPGLIASAVAARGRAPGGGRSARTPRAAPRRTEAPAAAQPSARLELDTIASGWQLALDAAERALSAARKSLPGPELAERRRRLARERHETATSLARLARVARVQPVPWLSPVPVTTHLLGLPVAVRACLFDVEGVLTDSAVLHASAWGEVFDDFLLRLSEKTGWHVVPFDRVVDYRAYIDGRSRLEGVHAFLGSRGIRLPEGRADDPAEADTASGLAKRKGEALTRGLRGRGVSALPAARRYLEAAGRAGLGRAVVSASANTMSMLELAGLAALVEARVDAETIRVEGLRSRPAPDVLLTACRNLGVQPEEAVTFTHTPAGVAAGLAAGVAVIAVGEGPQAELLRGFGADRVIPSLGALLAPRLSGDAPAPL
ncbi:MAG: HAD family hydrolase [Candidatus Limnocylindria bacterium]